MMLPVLPRPQRTQTRMPNAKQRQMTMIWPTWKSVNRWSTAAAKMLAASAAKLHLKTSHRRLLRLARAMAAGVDVEKALGVGEAAGVAPKAAAGALKTRLEMTLVALQGQLLQSHRSMSGSTRPSTASRRVWSSRAVSYTHLTLPTKA